MANRMTRRRGGTVRLMERPRVKKEEEARSDDVCVDVRLCGLGPVFRCTASRRILSKIY
jgi:hypothetical protein